MLLTRASPTFLPSTSAASPSPQQAPSSPTFGRSQYRRGGGLVSVSSPVAGQRCAARRRSVMAAAGAVPAAKLENADALIDSVETFIFDCDGEMAH